MDIPIETTDYGMFKKHPMSKVEYPPITHRIKESIKKQNLLKFRPILVDRNFVIHDGWHRLQAAKELGVPIWYTIFDESTLEI